jgi:quaternary ammonium compound-resistance protein SugE
MAWVALLVSAVLEALWATALGESDGFTRPWPVVVFFVGLVLSMLGLGYAARSIPITTAYAIWTGVGAALTVAYAILSAVEPATLARLAFLSGIVAAVIGLKLVSGKKAETPGRQ